MPLRFTKWLFAFYVNDFAWNIDLKTKLTKKEISFYEL